MANRQPLVSVFIPFFNAPFLSEAVESILSQSYENYELLLIDNGSTDSSSRVARSFLSNPRVRIIKESRRGVFFAANRAIAEARGEYLARMDADDLAAVDRLKLQVAFLNENSQFDAVSGLVEYLGSDANEGFIEYVDWMNGIRTAEEIEFNQFVEFPTANPTLMYRKSVFQDCAMYSDGDFPEDYEYFLRMLANGCRIGKVDKTILKWRDTPNRLTRTDDRYSRDAFYKIKAEYLAKWLEKNNPFHPKIFVWGAGRLSRRRSDYLKLHGVEIEKYIDLKAGNNTISYQKLSEEESPFIVSYVGNRGAREEIRSYLHGRGFVEFRNYIIAS